MLLDCTDRGNFYSQMVIKIREQDGRKGDIPDHVVAKLVDNLPRACILVSDTKKNSMDEGKNQVLVYMRSLQSIYLCLGLIITHHKLCLQLFIPFEGKFSETCR